MEPYFVWNGTDSREMDVWVLKYPPIVRPPQRYQQVTIPGRPGALTLLEGRDVFDPYVRELRIMPKPGADIYRIINWLTGSGEVIFGCEPERSQVARIYDQTEFAREFADQRSASVMFLCDPFKTNLFAPSEIVVDVSEDGYTLKGSGDVVAYPLLRVTATGTCTVTVNGVDLAITDLSGDTAYIDCGARVTYTQQTVDDVTNNVPVVTHGDYFELDPHADNSIAWTEGITALTIFPNWRWF